MEYPAKPFHREVTGPWKRSPPPPLLSTALPADFPWLGNAALFWPKWTGAAKASLQRFVNVHSRFRKPGQAGLAETLWKGCMMPSPSNGCTRLLRAASAAGRCSAEYRLAQQKGPKRYLGSEETKLESTSRGDPRYLGGRRTPPQWDPWAGAETVCFLAPCPLSCTQELSRKGRQPHARFRNVPSCLVQVSTQRNPARQGHLGPLPLLLRRAPRRVACCQESSLEEGRESGLGLLCAL